AWGRVRKSHRHFDALVGSGFNLDLSAGVLAESLNDECAHLSRNGPHKTRKQADTIVSNHDGVAVLLVKTFDTDQPGAAVRESVFEGVGDELIDEQADRERYVDRDRRIIHFQIETYAVRCVGA